MSFDGYNLRTQDYGDVIEAAERALDVRLRREQAAFGAQGASVGFPSDRATWVHLVWRALDDAHGSWVGAELASALVGVRKPRLLRSYRWVDESRNVVWRADESDLVTSRSIDSSGVLAADPGLGDRWWSDLASSLAALGAQHVDRIAVAQEHLSKRIGQVFGDLDLDTTVPEWTTAHADLHWGNVTGPSLQVLDWESWGIAPRGYDAATLWGHSLRIPAVAARIQQAFSPDLNTRSGLLAQLLFCSNVVRLGRNRPTPGPLVAPASIEADRLIKELTR